MREIKFRGKIEQGLRRAGEWVYGYYTYDVLYPDSEKHHWINGWRVDSETVGQYTGLPDKNGVEIYEGDTVVSFKKDYEDTPSSNIVEFTKGCWKLVSKGINDIPLFNYSSKQLDVTGNIHDKQLIINKSNTSDNRD